MARIEIGRRRIIEKNGEYLRKEFEAVCRDFFPDWNDQREWKVRFTPGKAATDGFCTYEYRSFPASKTILIRSDGGTSFGLGKSAHFRLYYDGTGRRGRPVGVRLTPKQALQVVLIHEICHVVKGYGLPHGKEWSDRMKAASMRAKELGRNKLGEVLYKESRRWEPIRQLGDLNSVF